MDNVTHTLVGVVTGHAFFRERGVPRAVPLLALSSNLPDVDVLVHLTGDPAAILLRRSFGHSLLLLPVWAFLFALLARRLEPRLTLRGHFGLALLGAALHVLFDLINSFGVLLLWPLSGWRPEAAMVFIIDLVLTGLLLLPLVVVARRRFRPRLPALSRAAAVAVAAYLVFCGINRAIASGMLHGAVARGGPPVDGAGRGGPAGEPGVSPDFLYVFPEPFGPHRWRGVVRRGSEYTLYLVEPLVGRIEARRTLTTSLDDPLVREARASEAGRRLERFFKAPVWEVRAASPPMACVHDLRFQPLVADRGRVFPFCLPRGAAPGEGHWLMGDC